MRATLLPLFAALVALATASTASAADDVVNGSGQLTGATGVNVNGKLYDVTFVDGTCTSIFSGCDEASDFTFGTVADANAAAQALLDQVFLDTFAGSFDTIPGLTYGCGGSPPVSDCLAAVPFRSPSVFNPVGYDAVFAANYSTESSDTVIRGPNGVFGGARDYDTTQDRTIVFAKFSLAAVAVPEPSSWSLLVLGFGLLGAAARYRRRIGPRPISAHGER